MVTSSVVAPELVTRWKELTEVALPRLAREQRWPLRLDHCFKRICLDNACGGVWYNSIPKPAERHATTEQLASAVHFAERIAAQGLPALNDLNGRSLAWRKKRERS